jgi:hypothetical protein
LRTLATGDDSDALLMCDQASELRTAVAIQPSYVRSSQEETHKDVSRQRSSVQVDVHVLLFQQRPRWNSGVFISGMEEKKVLVL